MLVGNAGANVLNGGWRRRHRCTASAATTFIMSTADDRVLEDAGGGIDYVVARASYALGGGRLGGVAVDRQQCRHGGDQPDRQRAGQHDVRQCRRQRAGRRRRRRHPERPRRQRHLFRRRRRPVCSRMRAAATTMSWRAPATRWRAGVSVELLSTDNNAGTAAINLTGNELANMLVGNAGANVLDGGPATTSCIGLGGADTFAFTTALGAGNVDTIADFAVRQRQDPARRRGRPALRGARHRHAARRHAS